MKFLEPDLIVRTVCDIEPNLLKRWGVRDIVVDLDNTVAARNEEELRTEPKEWLKRLKKEGFRVFVLSNNSKDRVKRALGGVSVDGVLAPAGKPFLARIRRFLQKHRIEPKKSVLIGDQVFTDIMAAKRLGMRAVFVYPLSDYDLPHTRLLRLIEKRLLARWEK